MTPAKIGFVFSSSLTADERKLTRKPVHLLCIIYYFNIYFPSKSRYTTYNIRHTNMLTIILNLCRKASLFSKNLHYTATTIRIAYIAYRMWILKFWILAFYPFLLFTFDFYLVLFYYIPKVQNIKERKTSSNLRIVFPHLYSRT